MILQVQEKSYFLLEGSDISQRRWKSVVQGSSFTGSHMQKASGVWRNKTFKLDNS